MTNSTRYFPKDQVEVAGYKPGELPEHNIVPSKSDVEADVASSPSKTPDESQAQPATKVSDVVPVSRSHGNTVFVNPKTQQAVVLGSNGVGEPSDVGVKIAEQIMEARNNLSIESVIARGSSAGAAR